MGSQLQRKAPERASKARTTPAGISTRPLSSIAEPTTTISSITAGGEDVIPARAKAGDIAQADFTSLAEVGTGRAGSRIERNEAGVEGSFKQSATAGLGSWPRGIEPCGDAAVDESVSVVSVQVDFWVVCPALLAGFWIECDDAIE